MTLELYVRFEPACGRILPISGLSLRRGAAIPQPGGIDEEKTNPGVGQIHTFE